ncbi:MAG TPA: mechanosensitive ion channel family protein [Candidatus Acidoferrales bacterium]|nr:mechanosensitive ion channel family protein [Candidatus Acidoferrales bacterium]
MHDRILALLWPLLYVALGIAAGITLQQVWAWSVARRVERRFQGLSVATNAAGTAIFICVALLGIYAATISYQLPEHTLDFIRKLLLAIALMAATWVAGRTSYGFVGFYSRSATGLLPQTSLMSSIAELAVFVIGGLIVLGSLGIAIAPILTALGVGGLAVGLALSAPLANLFAGIQIIASRELKPGQYVKFDGGVEGWVVDIAWNNTSIRDRSDSLIVIPNSKVTTTSFTNYDLPDSHMTIEIKATISPDSDLDEAENVIHGVAVDVLKVCKVTSQFDPQVRFLELTDSRIEFVVFLRSDTFVDQFQIRHEFVKRLHKSFRRDPKALPILTGVPA